LTGILEKFPESDGDYTLLKLEEKKYGSCPMVYDKFMLRSLVDHWDMGNLMKTPPEQRDGEWPPAEEFRRTAAIGAPLPGMPWELRPRRIHGLPAVLTSFAYREEYFPELEGMVATIRNYHPNWHVVIGRGPVSGFDRPTLEIDSPKGKSRWTLPVSFQLDGSENDWLRIARMKAWWVEQVWHHFGSVEGGVNRVVWLDADARLRGPLDLILEPKKEIVAYARPASDGTPADHICSGLLVFQGSKGGATEAIISQWSTKCLRHICSPPPAPNVWAQSGGDQEVPNTLLKSEIERAQFTMCKPDYDDNYCKFADSGADADVILS
jgi:hypothetical protein